MIELAEHEKNIESNEKSENLQEVKKKKKKKKKKSGQKDESNGMVYKYCQG